MAATRMAAVPTPQGRPKRAAYCSLKASVMPDGSGQSPGAAEPRVVVPEARHPRAASGRADGDRAGVPPAAPEPPRRAAAGTLGIAGRSRLVVAGVVGVGDPLEDVAGHVLDAIRTGAGRVGANGTGRLDGEITVGVGRIPLLAPGIAPAV